MLKTIKAAPLPIVLVVLSFLCPTELSIHVADLRLPPHRIALLVLAPIAMLRILSRTDVRIRSFDILFLFYNVWVMIAFTAHGEGNAGLVFGGSQALESFGAYIVARAWVRDQKSFLATLNFLVLVVLVAIMLALPEMLLGQHFTHDLFQKLTGVEWPRRIETRLGLTRAYATFDHPIHLGTFCATLLAMVWYVSRQPVQRYKRAMLVSVATFTALSSAPILCLFSQIGLIAWDRVTRGLTGRVPITIVGVLAFMITFSLLSNRGPFAFIATGLTIDSWTGYYRLLIWEHGLLNVWSHPWLGIGLSDWERPWWMVSDSVDAFWLVIAMRTGVPALVLIVSAIGVLMWAGLRASRRARDPLFRRAMKAWVISLIALSLAGLTVHYWNVLHAYFFFFLGLAGWIADPMAQAVRQRPDVAEPMPKQPYYLPVVYPHSSASEPQPASGASVAR